MENPRFRRFPAPTFALLVCAAVACLATGGWAAGPPAGAAANMAAATGGGPITAGRMVRFGDGVGYLVEPATPGRHAAVIVIQEWWGLNGWVKQQARRLARRGYVALAPDLYHGKVATTPRQAMQLMRSFDVRRGLQDLESAYDYLWRNPRVAKGQIGEIGWCFGGGMAARFAERQPMLKACVIYYGDLPSKGLGLIRCPVLGNFGGADRVVTPARAQAFARALRANGVAVNVKIYPGMPHAFAHLQTAAGVAATKDAWARTIGFFQAHLRGQ
jgi:carboxymethylenebutenolidase